MEIKEFNGEGYQSLISYNGWRVAIVNACERLKEENLCRMERHLKTNEVFILLQGEANLYIGENRRCFPLVAGKIYNVQCGEWHCISMKDNAKVAVIENDDTNDENTERVYF